MNKKLASVLSSAVIAGLLSGASALANEEATHNAGTGSVTKEEKNSCKGEKDSCKGAAKKAKGKLKAKGDSCKGADGCGGKKHE